MATSLPSLCLMSGDPTNETLFEKVRNTNFNGPLLAICFSSRTRLVLRGCFRDEAGIQNHNLVVFLFCLSANSDSIAKLDSQDSQRQQEIMNLNNFRVNQKKQNSE